MCLLVARRQVIDDDLVPDRNQQGGTMDLTGRTVLAFGTAGAQSAALPPSLRGAGALPRRATTDPGRAAGWTAAGEDAVVADLTDPASVLAAAEGAAAVAAHLPLRVGPGMPAAAASLAAVRRTGVPVVVNTGTPVPPPGAPDPFGSRPVAESLLDAGVTLLTPTAYLENHAAPWALESLRGGRLVYPRPAGDPLAWIAARDVAAALVAALVRDVDGELLTLAGPHVLTFDQLAAEIGRGLGRDVVFTRIDPGGYGELVRPVLGDEAAAGVAGAYAGMPEGPNPAMAPDAGPTWDRLGLSPTPASVWAREVLAPLL
jgi:uncharacterized protein YbjT (DUF2867 family)